MIIQAIVYVYVSRASARGAQRHSVDKDEDNRAPQPAQEGAVHEPTRRKEGDRH